MFIEDEEYDGRCRVTRERFERYDAITCGIYGEMVHTVFVSPEQSKEVYEQIEADLAEFIDYLPDDYDSRYKFYEMFTTKC